MDGGSSARLGCRTGLIPALHRSLRDTHAGPRSRALCVAIGVAGVARVRSMREYLADPDGKRTEGARGLVALLQASSLPARHRPRRAFALTHPAGCCRTYDDQRQEPLRSPPATTKRAGPIKTIRSTRPRQRPPRPGAAQERTPTEGRPAGPACRAASRCGSRPATSTTVSRPRTTRLPRAGRQRAATVKQRPYVAARVADGSQNPQELLR